MPTVNKQSCGYRFISGLVTSRHVTFSLGNHTCFDASLAFVSLKSSLTCPFACLKD